MTVLSRLLVPLLAAGLSAQIDPPVFPEGSPVPRSLTAGESAWLAVNPLAVPESVTPPPTGPLHCAAEYEAMASILVAWEGPSAWLQLLANMGAAITTVGTADFVVVLDSAGEESGARSRIAAAGADMARVRFVVVPTDTIWIRDYGPRYVFQGDVRVIIDHTYNRPRPKDNAFNGGFSALRGHQRYELGLVHGGGNFHLDARGRARTTRLINNENPTLSEPEIHDIWQRYQAVDTRFYQPFPRSVDSTQHIDMWMQVIADDAVVISDWPFNPGSVQAQICDSTAQAMAAEGYTVHRVPARSVGGVHYTYTNVVLCNGLVLIPSYTNSTVSPHNAQALAVWRAAMPNKTVRQLNCQSIVTAAGVMHCIVMHQPGHRGGLDPTAYLIDLNGGEVLQPGQPVTVRWVSDDDVAVVGVDLWLSTDGGGTFATQVASGLPANGEWLWTVPDLCSGQARLRVVASDATGGVGTDDSDADFAIAGTGCAAAVANYGAGTPGTAGVPSLTATPPRLGASVRFDLGSAWPSALGVLAVGANSASAPVLGGTLLVQPAAVLGVATGAAGTAAVTVAVPGVLSLAGRSLFWQAWIAGDPGAPQGFAASAGLATRLGF